MLCANTTSWGAGSSDYLLIKTDSTGNLLWAKTYGGPGDDQTARAAGLGEAVCCHTFRATGITAYLEAGGTVEQAQAIACHESPRTTKLNDRTSDQLTLDEIEKIQI